jgi:3-methyladenine DNA glycosylase Tag
MILKGVPVYDNCKLFEMLILEGMQAGLSWSLIEKQEADVFILVTQCQER